MGRLSALLPHLQDHGQEQEKREVSIQESQTQTFQLKMTLPPLKFAVPDSVLDINRNSFSKLSGLKELLQKQCQDANTDGI